MPKHNKPLYFPFTGLIGMDPGLFLLNLASASLRLCKKFSLEQQEKGLSKNRCNSWEVINGAVDSTGSLFSLLSSQFPK